MWVKILRPKVTILTEHGRKILFAVAEHYSRHCNGQILKKFLKILPEISQKLISSELRDEIFEILKVFIQVLQRLFIADQNKESLEVLSVDTVSQLQPAISNPGISFRGSTIGFDIKLTEERVFVRGYFKIDKGSPPIQSLFHLSKGKTRIS